MDRIVTAARSAPRAEHIGLCIATLSTRFAMGGVIDGIADFAALPAMVMTREFAAPESNFQMLIDTANLVRPDDQTHQDYNETPQRISIEAAEAATRFQRYTAPRIEAARLTRSNTMPSELVNARKDGEPALTLQNIPSTLIVFLTAAIHSTTGMLGWALQWPVRAARHPGTTLARARGNRPLVEETLRMHGMMATSFRTTTRDTTLGDVRLPAGSQVFLRWDQANVDKQKWTDPLTLDIDRKGVRNPMAFGDGIHFCVGNTLAGKEKYTGAQGDRHDKRRIPRWFFNNRIGWRTDPARVLWPAGTDQTADAARGLIGYGERTRR